MKTSSVADKTADTADTINTAADTVHKLTDKARNLADGVLQSTQDALTATQDAATASIAKAHERVEKWHSEADPALSEFANKAQVLAERSIHYCADTSAKMREKMDKCTESTTRYVAEQPGKSIAIAATVGAALALASAALWRRRDH